MRFAIHISARGNNQPRKFFVAAVPAVIAGIWSEPDREILTPDRGAIRLDIPFRFRRAWQRDNPVFWFDNAARWHGDRHTGSAPYATLHDSRGKWLATVTAIPCGDE